MIFLMVLIPGYILLAALDDQHIEQMKLSLKNAVEKKCPVIIKRGSNSSLELVKIRKVDGEWFFLEGGIVGSQLKSSVDIYPIFPGVKDRYEITLIDKSTIRGAVADVDMVKNTITFITKHKKHTITMDKILNIKLIQDEITVILKEGSRYKGILINDDGREIIVKTILGEEKFKRVDLLEIDYK